MDGLPARPTPNPSQTTMDYCRRNQPKVSQLQPINLESDTDQSETDDPKDDAEDTTLTQENCAGLPSNGGAPSSKEGKQITLATLNEKVDRLLLISESSNKRIDKNAAKCRKNFLNIQSAHNAVVNSINTLDARANSADDVNEQTRALVNECLRKINELTHKTDVMDKSYNTRLETVEKAVVELGTEVKERKLIISGLKEEKGENVRQVALKSIKKALTLAKSAQEKETYDGVTFSADPNQISLSSLEQVYRVGVKKSSWPPRNILVSFKDSHHRFILLKTKPFLADAEDVNFYLEEDMTTLTRSHKSKLKRIMNAAKSENLEAKIVGNRINIDGTLYGFNDLDTIPENLTTKIKEEKEVKGGIAYRGRESIYSNFYPSSFEIDGTNYNSVEQYYQHSKAVACNNLERARKIMKCTDPRRIKELGDGVRNGNNWLPERVSTLYKGTLAKFQQNPDLAVALVSTGSLGLFEATTDYFFGCGIGLQSTKWSTKEWTGENVAGRIVMKVRAELTGEAAPDATLEGTKDISTYNPLDKLNADSYSSVENDSHETCPNGDGSLNADMSLGHHRPANESNLHKRKQYRRRGGRGRGRGTPGRGSPGANHPSNVTGRSSRRQSAYAAQAQLSDKDYEFLKMNSTRPSKANPGISTSTPKTPPGYNSSQLSDSELNAMGIDPNSKYAEDVRRKYSAAATGNQAIT